MRAAADTQLADRVGVGRPPLFYNPHRHFSREGEEAADLSDDEGGVDVAQVDLHMPTRVDFADLDGALRPELGPPVVEDGRKEVGLRLVRHEAVGRALVMPLDHHRQLERQRKQNRLAA